MGTNFYLFTQDRAIKDCFYSARWELTDTPDFGYELHIAKTSCGWLPLFEASGDIRSVKDIKSIYDTGEFKIFDEYGTEYNWDEFKERVLQFNGGTVKNRKVEPYVQNKDSRFYDPDFPDYTPISHFEYGGIKNRPDVLRTYFTDPDGYEFCTTSFT